LERNMERHDDNFQSDFRKMKQVNKEDRPDGINKEIISLTSKSRRRFREKQPFQTQATFHRLW
ncbi:hypothetical protein KEM09_21840, partial [Carboxylicivirga mesophila]